MDSLKFDLSDPATKKILASWEPNTQYTIQTGQDPISGVVTTAMDEEEPQEPASPQEEPAASPGPAAVKSAMMGGY